MKKTIPLFLIALFTIFALIATVIFHRLLNSPTQISGAPPYLVDDTPPMENDGSLFWLENWKRPEGPVKVALQVGHYKSSEVPEELKRLRQNTGTSGGGKAEWEVNLEIANRAAGILKERGIETEILPATIPPGYFADVFIAVHADGSLSSSTTGFKAATPRRDMSGKAIRLLESVEIEYESATKLSKDPNVTRNMRGYYAFAWWRYEHSIHPMTTAIILETGFLTNPADRQVIVSRPELAAYGMAQGVIKYLISEKLIEPKTT